MIHLKENIITTLSVYTAKSIKDAFVRFIFPKTDIKEIDREVVVSFIKKIEVYDDKTIDIYFNFKKPSFIA